MPKVEIILNLCSPRFEALDDSAPVKPRPDTGIPALKSFQEYHVLILLAIRNNEIAPT